MRQELRLNEVDDQIVCRRLSRPLPLPFLVECTLDHHLLPPLLLEALAQDCR